MNSSTEFVKGKHGIGWVSSDFANRFKDVFFEERPMPTFQKLPRAMSDATIESELKPGLCELGDVLAFLENAPEECKDGNWNLFYFSAFVVNVYWFAGIGEWFVSTWYRDDDEWFADDRVFSPATVRSDAKTSDLGSSDTSALERAIGIVVMAGYRVTKE